MSEQEILKVLREHSAAELAEHFLTEKERVYRLFVRAGGLRAKILGLMLLYQKTWTLTELSRSLQDYSVGRIHHVLKVLGEEGWIQRLSHQRWQIRQKTSL